MKDLLQLPHKTMPLFTKAVASIAALLAIPVFGIAVIGTNYQSAILHHLVDIVNGSNTSVVASLNAPNWAEGITLAQVVGASAATTTTSGTVASSTPFTFAIAATDGTGTTTLSSTATVTTDASTSPNEEIQVTWGAVPGATGYAIFFATSSNATIFSQYFYATSTNGSPNAYNTFATSTGSLAGSYTRINSTAFATKINPIGMSYLNGGGLQILGQTLISTTTAASSTALEINAYTRAQLSATSTACYSATAGVMFYNSTNKHEWGCDGTNCNKIF